VFEALSYGDVPTTAYLSIHNMVAAAVDRYGTHAQRATWLPRLCAMDALASYCLTEPGSGSDAGERGRRGPRLLCGPRFRAG
jgi:alkylation response protein AidB-like acyl-CoA dehydrogenase